MIRRSFDAARFNEIANHESVRPWLGGEGELDLAGIVSNPANVALLGDHGGFVNHNLGEGRYEVHSLFLPEGRGSVAIEAMRRGMEYMFTATDCVELVTKCPDGNRAALGIARVGGIEEQFRREAAWSFNGDLVGVSYRAISLAKWISRAPECLVRGQWFHKKLEAAKVNSGSNLVAHEDDEAHDRAVGASVLMALAGNARKSVWAYNRWAIFAGYQPIMLLSDAPILIDVVDAIVSPKADDMEILLCR